MSHRCHGSEEAFRPRMRLWRPANSAAPRIILVVILFAGVAGPARLLLHWPVALGLDGYYYVLQVEAIRTDGVPWSRTFFSGDIYLITLLGLWSDDVVFANKVAALTALVGFVAVTYVLIHLVTESAGYGLLGSATAAFSPLRYYFAVEYLGQLIGILWYAVAVCLWVLAERSVMSVRRGLYAAMAFTAAGAALWSHKSGAVLLAATVLLVIGRGIWGRFVTPFQSRYVLATVAGVSVLSAIVVLATVYGVIPSTRPWLAANARPLPLPDLWGFSFAPESLFLILTIVIIVVSGYSHVTRALKGHGAAVFPILLGMALLFCANPFLRYKTALNSASERMGLTALMWTPIVAVVLLRVLELTVPPLRARAAIAGALLCISLVPRMPFGAHDGYMKGRMALAQQLGSLRHALPSTVPITAEHGTQFLVTAVTGRESYSPARVREPVEGTLSLLRDRHHQLCPSLLENTYCLAGWTLLPAEALRTWTTTAKSMEFLSIVNQNPQYSRRLAAGRTIP